MTDLDIAVAFYRDLLGFEEELRPSPAFAMLYSGDLRLLLSVPGHSGGGDILPDGSVPTPGGWNRIALRTGDLDTMVAELRSKGARFRTGIITGVAVRQVLLHDPAGQPGGTVRADGWLPRAGTGNGALSSPRQRTSPNTRRKPDEHRQRPLFRNRS